MQKKQSDTVNALILRRFMNRKIIGMRYVNRQDIQFKKIGGDVIQKALDDLIKNGYLETHHKDCVSINPRMIKLICEYLEKS